MTLLNLPIVLFALPLEAAFGLVVFRGLWAVFIHSNASVPLGPLKLLFGAPELHHWHHDAEETECNFGNLAPWTDLLFGTHFDPGRMPARLGTAEALPSHY
jgi:sterol desaturase/sphingolipid hydroxylase (fatty acid hydroxylase superfamily)